jgi:hypothetical protein
MLQRKNLEKMIFYALNQKEEGIPFCRTRNLNRPFHMEDFSLSKLPLKLTTSLDFGSVI